MHSPNGYTLFARQQPVAARACGSADRPDRRPIDPIVIVQLTHEDTARLFADGEISTFFCVATLIEEPEKLENVPSDSTAFEPKSSNLLTGTILSSIFYLKDPAKSSQTSAFFVFSDLNIRSEGSYKLRFDVFRLFEQHVYPIANCISSYFTVFSAKRFPGMTNSTELSKIFSDQGLKIRIRKDIRVRKKPRTSHTPQITTLTRENSPEQTSFETRPAEKAAPRVRDTLRARSSAPELRKSPRLHGDAKSGTKEGVTEVADEPGEHHHYNFRNPFQQDHKFLDQGYNSKQTCADNSSQGRQLNYAIYDSTPTKYGFTRSSARTQTELETSSTSYNNYLPSVASPPVRFQPSSASTRPPDATQPAWRAQMQTMPVPNYTTAIDAMPPRGLLHQHYQQQQPAQQASQHQQRDVSNLVPQETDITIPADGSNRLPSFNEAFADLDRGSLPADRPVEQFHIGPKYKGSFPAPPRPI